MGASKASFPGASWLFMGMAESRLEMEEKARKKIIPAETCSAPAVGLRGPRGVDACPPSSSHPCTGAVHLQILMRFLQRCSGRTPLPPAPVVVPLLERVPVPCPSSHTLRVVLCNSGLSFSFTALTSTHTARLEPVRAGCWAGEPCLPWGEPCESPPGLADPQLLSHDAQTGLPSLPQDVFSPGAAPYGQK